MIGHNFRRERRATAGDWLRTVVAPVLATVLLGIMLGVAVTHVGTLGGTVGFVKAIPWVCLGWVVLGLGLALWLRSRRPETYARLGAVLDQLGTHHTDTPDAAHAPLSPVNLEAGLVEAATETTV